MPPINSTRNTTGHNLKGTLGGITGEKTSVRPRPGALQLHSGLPVQAMLAPQLINLPQTSQHLERVKQCLSQCERPVITHPGPLNARTSGRSAHFLKTVLRSAAKTVGMGCVKTPAVKSAWTRPDAPSPAKLSAHQSTTYQKLFGTSPQERALRHALEEKISQQAHDMVGHQVALRHASDTEVAFTGKQAHVSEVRQRLLDAVDAARQAHTQLLAARHPHNTPYRESAEALKAASTRKTILSLQHQQLSREQSRIEAELQATRRQLVGHRETLMNTPVAFLTEQAQDQAVDAYHRATERQHQLRDGLPLREQELQSAQHDLDTAKKRLWSTMRPALREQLSRDIDHLRQLRNQARSHLTEHRDTLHQTEIEVQRYAPAEQARTEERSYASLIQLQATLPQKEQALVTAQEDLNAAEQQWQAADPQNIPVGLNAQLRELRLTRNAAQAGLNAHRHLIRQMEARVGPERPLPSPTLEARAQAEAVHAQGLEALNQLQPGLLERQHHLHQAQVNLDAAKKRLRTTVLPNKRSHLHAEIHGLRNIRNAARNNLRQYEQTMEQRSAQVAGFAQQKEQLQDKWQGVVRQSRINHKINQLNLKRADLEQKSAALGEQLAHLEEALNAATVEYDTAKTAAEHPLRIPHDDAEINASRERLQQLEAQLERATTLDTALEAPTTEAQIQAAVLRDAEHDRVKLKLTALVNHPPGFADNQTTPEFKAQLRALIDRIDAVPDGMTADQVRAQQRARGQMPTEQIVQIVSQSLSLTTRGQGEEAQRVLADLMSRDFSDLVPPPYCLWTDRVVQAGQGPEPVPLEQTPRNYRGHPLDDSTTVKRTACLLAGLPCGVGLLQQIVQPNLIKPSRQLQDAVAVYLKATHAMSPDQTPDAASRRWLESAEEAAKLLAHPPEAQGAENTMAALPHEQRIAFNGVRNGFTSIALGSAYDQVLNGVEQLSKGWLSQAEAQSPRKSTQATRLMATTVATDVGLPNAENKLNQQLGIACDELLKRLNQKLLEHLDHPFGIQAGQPAALQPYLDAQNLLLKIKKAAGKAERLDTLQLSKRRWSSIREATQSQISALNKRVAQGGHHGPANLYPVNHELADCLTNIQKTKPSVFEILTQLKAHLPDAEDHAMEDEEFFDAQEVAEHDRDHPDDDVFFDAREPNRLDQALIEAETLLRHSQDFRDNYCSPEAIEQYLLPAIRDSYGGVALSQGHQAGISSSGITGVAVDLLSFMGLVIRPIGALNYQHKESLGLSRDALGTQIDLGRSNGISAGLGVSANVGITVRGTDKKMAWGPEASIMHSWGMTKTSGGLVIREPDFDGKPRLEQEREFAEMLSTMFRWSDLRDAAGSRLYGNAIEALLDRHPTISISTVESAKAITHSARSSLNLFAAAAGDAKKTNLLGALEVGLSTENTHTRSTYKSSAGAQGFVAGSAEDSHTLSANAGLVAKAGYANFDRKHLAATRGALVSAAAGANLRKTSAQSGSDIVRQPDGTILADRFVEYTSFEKFKAAVSLHREKWIQAAIDAGDKAGVWQEGLQASDKRLIAEHSLDDFLEKARQSLKAGTVTLNETMDVKPEVCAELNANLALEELARLGGQAAEVLALQAARQKLLEDDSSYQPFLLKAIVRSSAEATKGLNLVLNLSQSAAAKATHTYDYFPRSA